MSDHLAFLAAIAEPVQRRCWLLYRALDCLSPDQAIDWARQADDFITQGGAAPRAAAEIGAGRPLPAPVVAPNGKESVIALPAAVSGATKAASTVAPRAVAASAARPMISGEQRQRLIDRLASGAKNADLAAEFGLTPKQVQGVRIGCSREIAARRSAAKPPPAAAAPIPAEPGTLAVSVDDVVRYLRQQDDVVVPQAGGEFLVNARFRLQFDELVGRANRIRARQGKPEFTVIGPRNGAASGPPPANGHTLAEVA